MKPKKEQLASGEERSDGLEKVIVVPQGHMSFDDHGHKTIINQNGRDSEFATPCYGHMNF
jgi:hypothetical protein